MDATDSISGLPEPRLRVFDTRRDAAARQDETPAAPGIPMPFRAPEPIRPAFQARLNYDPLEADVFLEILDPETGEVIRRFPAEDAARDEVTGRGGALIDHVA